LNHDAGTVASLGVSANGTAMLEIFENAQAIVNGAVAFDVVDVGNEANAASVMFVARIVETMALGNPLR